MKLSPEIYDPVYVEVFRKKCLKRVSNFSRKRLRASIVSNKWPSFDFPANCESKLKDLMNAVYLQRFPSWVVEWMNRFLKN